MTSRRLLDPVSKALLDAADYMEAHGHCKDKSTDWMGRVCLIGAITRVVFRDQAIDQALHMATRNRLEAYLGYRLITIWNNAPERTADEAIAALRGAAIMEVEPAVAEG